MSRTIIMTSKNFEGDVKFVFSETGRLVTFDTTGATLDDKQAEWITYHCPLNLEELKKIIAKSRSIQLTEVEDGEIDFDLFWDKYNNKACSSKKRAKAKWDKMPMGERIKSYKYIDIYRWNLKPGVELKYAESYLNAELWNN